MKNPTVLWSMPVCSSSVPGFLSLLRGLLIRRSSLSPRKNSWQCGKLMPRSCFPVRGIEKYIKIIIALYFSSSVKDRSLISGDFFLTIQNYSFLFIIVLVSPCLAIILWGLLCPKQINTLGCAFNGVFSLSNNMITSKMNVVHLKFSKIECTFSSVQNAYHKKLHKNIVDW